MRPARDSFGRRIRKIGNNFVLPLVQINLC